MRLAALALALALASAASAQEPPAPPTQPTAPVAAVPPAPAPPPSAPAAPATLPAGRASGHRSLAVRVLPWLAVAAGAATMTAGALLLDKNGEGTCTLPPERGGAQCPQVWDTTAGGIALVSAGFAAAAAGGFVLVFGTGRKTTVSLAPGGLALARRF